MTTSPCSGWPVGGGGLVGAGVPVGGDVVVEGGVVLGGVIAVGDVLPAEGAAVVRVPAFEGAAVGWLTLAGCAFG